MLANELHGLRHGLRTLDALERPDQSQCRVRVRLVADPIPTLDHPVVERLVLRVRRLRVRQTQQVALCPTVALAVLDRLIRQLLNGLRVPRLDCGTETATPASKTLHVLREVEEVGTGARHLRQCLERCLARCWVTLRCREGEGKECWIILRCAARVRNLDDAADHAGAVSLDRAQEGLCLLERQLALADVERAALGPE